MKRIFLIVLGMAIAGLYFSFANNRLGFGGDAVEFLRLAESIRAGEGYTTDGRVSVFPPVTPALMSLFRGDVLSLKLLNIALAMAGLAFAYVVLRRQHESRVVLPAIILTGVCFPFIYNLINLGNEAPFFFFSMAALASHQFAGKSRRAWLWYVLTGVCIALAILSRAIGWTLLFGLGLWAAVHTLRDRKFPLPAIGAVAATLVVAGSWYAYVWQSTGQTNVSAYRFMFRKDIYEREQSDAGARVQLERVRDNLAGYAFIFSSPDAALRAKGQSRATVRGAVSVAIMLLAVAGYLWHLLRRPRFAECYLLFYGGAILMVAWYEIRYLVPVMPFLFFYMGFSIERALNWRLPKLATAGALIVFSVLIAANTAFSVASPQAKRLRSAEYEGTAKEIHDAAMWVKEHHAGSVVMTRWANMVWYWTRLKVVAVPYIADPDRMWEHIQQRNVEIIMASPDEFAGVTEKYLLPALRAHPERVELLTTIGQTPIYRVR